MIEREREREREREVGRREVCRQEEKRRRSGVR